MFMTYHMMFQDLDPRQVNEQPKDSGAIYMTAKHFVACCENCGNPIFEYDRYYRAHVHCQDVYLCRECCIEM